MTGPLPLDDVMRIVERRRRRRARVQTVAAPALSVAAAGVVVVALQVGSDGPGPAPAAPPISALPPSPAPPQPGGPSFDPGFLVPEFLPTLAGTLFGGTSVEEIQRSSADAAELSRVWGLEQYPAAKAVVAKADLTGVAIDPSDPQGDDVLAQRFAAAGFTGADAERLAAAWLTDERTARVVGGLLVEAGYAEG